MRDLAKIATLILVFVHCILWGQVAEFLPNVGQDAYPYSASLKLQSGVIYFEEASLRFNFFDPEFYHELHESAHDKNHGGTLSQKGIVYTQKWIGAQPVDAEVINSYSHYYNFYKGNNPNHWKSKVHPGKEAVFKDLYPGINVHFFQNGLDLKYNYLLDAGADYKQIEISFEGVKTRLLDDQTLLFETPFGDITEFIPRAYQLKGQKEISVEVSISQNKSGNYVFYIPNYDQNLPLVIDPILNFSTYSGSTDDNWGYTATYDDNGSFYAGGIVFGQGYPTTTGSYDITFSPNSITLWVCDIAISKFDSTGGSLLYSTYLGGSEIEHPHSMVTNSNGELFVYGGTGSSNFPTTTGAFDQSHNGGPSGNGGGFFTYPNGSDIYISKFSADGTQLLASTFVGGSDNDGFNLPNTGIEKNYGDFARGEIILDEFGNPFIITSTNSSDFPNTFTTNLGGTQDAVVFNMDLNLTTLGFATYFGGGDLDAGYGIDYDASTNKIFITGGTFSTSLPNTTGVLTSSNQGGLDGFLARVNAVNGAIETSTFVGTVSDDQLFFVNLAPNGHPYVFGQTKGSIPLVGGSPLHVAGGKTFVQAYTPDLSALSLSFSLGNSSTTADPSLVPTAFNVDDCYRIFFSGWGGFVNSSYDFSGNVQGFSTTPDAYDNNTNGSDFYFAVLSAMGDSLIYGTFFGGTANEHVDGGTSRFSPDGIIFQGVCAGCGNNTFPTTSNAWSTTNNSNNCNYGAIKMTFDTYIDADLEIDTSSIIQNCDTLTVGFINKSRSAQLYYWDFGNGDTSMAANPDIMYTTRGTYTITLIATDTLCSVTDTAQITVTNSGEVTPVSDFTSDYITCDANREARFTNMSTNANQFFWNFGDGKTSTSNSPTHYYLADGTYNVLLYSKDSTCDVGDTIIKTVVFNTNPQAPFVDIYSDSCSNGSISVVFSGEMPHYEYTWDFGNGMIDKKQYPTARYLKSGKYTITLTITDTLCSHVYTYTFNEDIQVLFDLLYIPNAFSPNGDGINESLEIGTTDCMDLQHLWIFDKWGSVVFETTKPKEEFWDGMNNGKPASQDVYTYRLVGEDNLERTGYILVIW